MKKLFFLLIILSVVFELSATVIYITNVNDAGLGSLRDGINNAVEGDTIRFNADLLDTGNDTILLNSNISFNKSLIIKGLYTATDTLFISGQNSSNIFNVSLTEQNTRTLVLDSMVMINGYSSSLGGAIKFVGEYLYVYNSVLRNNTANNYGGAIYSTSSGTGTTQNFTINHVIIENSEISYNQTFTSGGGGIWARANQECTVTIKDSNILFNTAGFEGGGISAFSDGASVQVNITGSTIHNNIANNGPGGGIYTASFSQSSDSSDKDSISLTIINSSIEENSAGAEGGGVYSYLFSYYDQSNYNVIIEESSISHNTAILDGGGLYSYSDNHPTSLTSSSLIISRSQINDNVTQGKGGGIYSNGPITVPAFSNITIDETTISQNTAELDGGGLFSRSYYGSVEMLRSTISDNTSVSGQGGGVYAFSYYSNNFFNYALIANTSTISNNSANEGGGIYSQIISAYYEAIRLENATIYNNTANNAASLYTSINTYNTPHSLYTESSIVSSDNPSNIETDFLLSGGYNIFSDASIIGNQSTDQLNISNTLLSLSPLQNNGGFTFTHIPQTGSVATDAGNPLNNTDAQNWEIIGIRETGAAETTSLSFSSQSFSSCGVPITSPSGNIIWDTSGTFTDTLIGINNSFQIITANVLISENTYENISVNTCDSYTSPSGIIYDQSENLMDTIPNFNGCDSIINIDLIILETDNTISVSTTTLTANEQNATYQWINCEGDFIGNETNQSFTATESGNYAVIIYNGECVDTSACHAINITGIVVEYKPLYIETYPNPTDGTFFIDLKKNYGKIALSLIDISGKKVHQTTFSNSQEIKMNIVLPSGVYFIEIETEEGIFISKIIFR
jgi:predicted outer membrane repeat protein